MINRFFAERGNRYANGSVVIDRSTGDYIADCPDFNTAEVIASMFNNRVRFNEPIHNLSSRDTPAGCLGAEEPAKDATPHRVGGGGGTGV